MSAMKAMRQVMEAEASVSRLQSEVSERVVDLGFTLQEEVVDEKVPVYTHTHTHTHTHPSTSNNSSSAKAICSCLCVCVCPVLGAMNPLCRDPVLWHWPSLSPSLPPSLPYSLCSSIRPPIPFSLPLSPCPLPPYSLPPHPPASLLPFSPALPWEDWIFPRHFHPAVQLCGRS